MIDNRFDFVEQLDIAHHRMAIAMGSYGSMEHYEKKNVMNQLMEYVTDRSL